jgi:hypothetical protein
LGLLSGGVVQLVLSRALETILDTGILPELRNGIADLGREVIALDLLGLHEDGLDVVLGALIIEGELKRLHGLKDDTHGLDSVAEDDLLEGLSLVTRIATLVNELHLLQDGRLSGLTGS